MKKNKIYLFCKGDVSAIPPVYNLALGLASANFEVILICGEIKDTTYTYLKEKSPLIKIEHLHLDRVSSRIGKIHTFRRKVGAKFKNTDDGIVWFATFDTAISLYNSSVYKKNNFFISVLELYDTAPRYVRIFLKLILPEARTIIAVEYNRAAIMRVKYKLKNTPKVLPNKPFDIFLPPETEEITIKKKEMSVFARGRKIILYQGLIADDRNLDLLAKTIQYTEETFCFVLLGPNIKNYVDHLKRINNNTNILYLGNFAAPAHLHFTSLADIGILKYDFIDLNNIYCAPNKLWEYTAFSLPLLCNDIPGLRNYIEKYGAGVLVDFNNESDISNQLIVLENNFEQFQVASKNLYTSFNYKETLQKIISSDEH